MKQQSVVKSIAKAVGYLFLFLACQAVAGFLAEVAILALFTASGMDFAQALSDLTQVYNRLIYEIMTLSSLVFLGFLVLMQREKFLSINSLKKTKPTALFAGVFLGFACYLAAGLLIQVANVFPAFQASQESYLQQQQALDSAGGFLWAEMLYACVLAPVAEEILCRGAVLTTLKKGMAPTPAIVLSAIAFSLIHGNLYQIVFTLPLGILLGWLTHRFSSLWPAIGLHMAFNSTNYLFRIGDYLGFEQEGPWWTFCVMAAYLFCLISFPFAVLLLREATDSVAKPAKPAFDPMNPMNHVVKEEKGDAMAAPEYVIVGLGNPGEKYASNRHNCGFMALDYIALRQNVKIQNLRFHALTADTVIDGKKVLLMKPQTFMNSSGQAVREAASFYKIPAERILVIFDDISFPPGVFRIRKSGSAGGHNGIKSIIASLSSDAFPRVKMGVGTPPQGWELMNWVLGNLSKEDLEHVIACMEDVFATAKAFLNDDLDRASAMFNGKNH